MNKKEDQEKTRDKIKALVEKYSQIKNTGLLKKYSEEETKKDFILPLFEALGWDVHDKREVSAEEHIKSSGRVDYGFYISDRIQFYLEAKNLKVDLHKEEYARQAIRYSWNKGVTWAVLTDFESIIVFNTQDIEASLASKRLFEISYDEYLERLDQLLLLSKESFEKSLINKEAERLGKKFQKVPISSLLYNDLNESREMLTKSLAAWNDGLQKDRQLLDEGVQKLLDRLIFLRVAEDRGIEPSTLIPLVRAWEASKNRNETSIYSSMVSKFRELDETYDSNLFTEHPFENWVEYDGTTEKVIKKLYGKEGYYEYDFKAMPADVLGAVYENYLGYKLSQSKKGVKVHKDSTKRKERGIYYTPTFIVEYIVKNALGPVLDKCRTIEDLKKIKVLDPACGSGSFLVKALELINEKYKKMGMPGNVFTKAMILTTNIYGVDLDEQAVEIARLNLLINALDERFKLPLLDKNIKNGNSLISGTDAELQKKFGANFNDKKPFNWEEEFPEVFKQGGFDVIIGNPPYVNLANIKDADEREYYKSEFKTAKNKSDLYSFFTEKAVRLLKEKGILGFIVSNSWLSIDSFSKFRKFLVEETMVIELVKLPPDVFPGAIVTTVLIFLKKQRAIKKHQIKLREYLNGNFADLQSPLSYEQIKNTSAFNFSFQAQKQFLVSILRLVEIADLSVGIKTSDDKRFVFDKKSGEEYHPFLLGKNIRRYYTGQPKKFIWYKPELMRQKVGAVPLNLDIFNQPKILVKDIGKSIQATFDNNNYLAKNTLNLIYNIKSPYDPKYILALLNSKTLSYWFISNFPAGLHLQINQLEQIPIYKIYFLNKKEKQKHDNLAALADKMLELNKKLQYEAEGSNAYEKLKSEIEKTDKKIDEEVYKLYGLTPEEIRIIENGERLTGQQKIRRINL